jgi:hypothetical protein
MIRVAALATRQKMILLVAFAGHSVLVGDKGEEKDKLHDDIWALNLATQKVGAGVCCS